VLALRGDSLTCLAKDRDGRRDCDAVLLEMYTSGLSSRDVGDCLLPGGEVCTPVRVLGSAKSASVEELGCSANSNRAFTLGISGFGVLYGFTAVLKSSEVLPVP
jgi:hypothetical protein